MIYVPDITNYQCFVVQSSDIIRAYEQVPNYNTTVNYRDYYIKSNYIFKDGSQSFGNYSYTTLPVCLDNSTLTTSYYYRNDFDSILIIFLIMCIFCFYIPLKIFVRLIRRLQ